MLCATPTRATSGSAGPTLYFSVRISCTRHINTLAAGIRVLPRAHCDGARVQDPAPSLNNHLTGVADRSRIPHSHLPASATAWPRSLKPAKLCLSLVEGRAAYAGPAANIPSPHRPNPDNSPRSFWCRFQAFVLLGMVVRAWLLLAGGDAGFRVRIAWLGVAVTGSIGATPPRASDDQARQAFKHEPQNGLVRTGAG